MPTLTDIRAHSKWRDILEGQPQHLGLIVFLMLGAGALFTPVSEMSPEFWGLSVWYWAWSSMGLAVLHQVLVAAVFRLQLHRNLVTRLCGQNDLAIWTAVFIPLLVARPVTVLLTGVLDTQPIGTPYGLNIGIGVIFVGIALYGIHSVHQYFTIPRAVGGDHFREEIAAMPLVDKGIFKYTSNAMYGPTFLGLWGIALLCDSWHALVLAAFQHVYIWVHYYCTEQPDMAWIYGNR
ncbi:hypothetical protein NBRC116594_23790 [Shimia sp. NS0008-38b]|uniref:methyltransferase n=1 Tax=Shimia sp. NS0008-38b TaxID=3127653 RepID=UPI0031082607